MRATSLPYFRSHTHTRLLPSIGTIRAGWKSSAGRGGFTLLEVMIALLIIATSFIVLLHSRNQSIIAADYAKSLTIATLLASEKMSEIEQEGDADAIESTGSFSDDFPGFTWNVLFSETAYEHIKEVRLQILWGHGRARKSLELINYVRKKE